MRWLGGVLALALLYSPALSQPNHNPDPQKAEQPQAVAADAKQVGETTTSNEPNHNADSREKHKEQCEYQGPSWFAGFYCFFALHDKFWVSFGTLVLAAFTTVLGAATIFLVTATKRLVVGAEKTAERQLRAYVSVEPVMLRDFAAGRVPLATFFMKNVGQTPALRIRHFAMLDILPHPLPDDQGDLLTPNPVARIPTRAVHPTLGIEGEARMNRLLTAQDVALVFAGTEYQLYLFGIIAYEDVFGKELRRTKFCCYVGGPEFAVIADRTTSQPPGHAGKIHWNFAVPHNEAT